MKARSGFVTNSSTCNFIVVNLSKESKSFITFLRENPKLVDMFNAGLAKDRLDSYERQVLAECNIIKDSYTIDMIADEAWFVNINLPPRKATEFMTGDTGICDAQDYFLSKIGKNRAYHKNKVEGESESFLYNLVEE